MNTVDTIAALATGIGGAVSIIRISGPNALAVANRVWRGRRRLDAADVRKMRLGQVDGNPTLAVYMQAPASYTGDDVVELQCHGGAIASQQVLKAVIGPDCRMAEPGEFTFRAFVNGKLDLTQAEAVADMIDSGSTAALQLAERQLAGSLSRRLDQIYDRINFLRSECEAHLDFPDEELDFMTDPAAEISPLRTEISRLIATQDAGKRLRDGIDIVLAGRPNAGKSSLLNQLLGFDRTIVSDIPGTTRDTVEAATEISGIPVRITDTAGLRDSADPIEAQGVDRSKRFIASAQVVFWLLDSSAPDLTAETAELLRQLPRRVIAIWNKIDLCPQKALPDLPCECVKISALTGDGIPKLKQAFGNIILESGETADIPEISVNARIAEALARADRALAAATAQFKSENWELAAAELAQSASALGETTGKTVSPDLLDQVFHRFCLGK